MEQILSNKWDNYTHPNSHQNLILDILQTEPTVLDRVFYLLIFNQTL